MHILVPHIYEETKFKSAIFVAYLSSLLCSFSFKTFKNEMVTGSSMKFNLFDINGIMTKECLIYRYIFLLNFLYDKVGKNYLTILVNLRLLQDHVIAVNSTRILFVVQKGEIKIKNRFFSKR